MKKTLLTIGLFACVTAYAQTSTSFKPTQHFEVNQSMISQFDWATFTSSEENTALAEISNSTSTIGTHSLNMKSNGQYSSDEWGVVAISPEFDNHNTLSIRFDIKRDASTNPNGGSDAAVMLLSSSEEGLVPFGQLLFSHTGTMGLVTYSENGANFTPFDGVEWLANHWYHIVLQRENNQLNAYVNGQFMGNVTQNPEALDVRRIAFVNDNNGTDYYVDNLNVSESLDTTWVNALNVQLVPNSKSDAFAISLPSTSAIESVGIKDLNGRLIKQFQGANAVDRVYNIADLHSGVYVVEVQSLNGTSVSRFHKGR